MNAVPKPSSGSSTCFEFSGRMKNASTSPVGAYAEIEGRRLLLRGFYADEDAKIYRKGKLAGPAAEAAAIGRNLAAALLEGREAS